MEQAPRVYLLNKARAKKIANFATLYIGEV